MTVQTFTTAPYAGELYSSAVSAVPTSGVAFTPTVAPTVGDLVLVIVATAGTPIAATCTGGGNTWFAQNNTEVSPTTLGVVIFSCIPSAWAGGSQFTITTNTAIQSIVIEQFTGVPSATAEQIAVHSSATNAAPLTGTTSTTLVAQELIVAAIVTTGSGVLTQDFPGTVISPYQQQGGNALIIEYEIATAVGTFQGAPTLQSHGPYAGVIATFPMTMWTAPAGVTSVQVENIAGGGGGGYANASTGAAGGGGGEYAEDTAIAVTPGNSYPLAVGSPGPGGSAQASTTSYQTGSAGQKSVFVGDSVTVTANGGGGGQLGAGTVGAGGTGSTNATHHNGGAGAIHQSTTNGGGGGGSAGPAAVGNTATTSTGATAVTGGGPGGNGATTAAAGNAPGSGPGGGGGGGRGTAGAPHNGGAGFAGQITLTYTATVANTNSFLFFMSKIWEGFRMPRYAFAFFAVLALVLTVSSAEAGTVTAGASNWGGYEAFPAQGQSFKSVTGTFTVPTLNCSATVGQPVGGTLMEIWVGLDGGEPTFPISIEQVGISPGCHNGVQGDPTSWQMEFTPTNPRKSGFLAGQIGIPNPSPGDLVVATTSHDGNEVTMSLSDKTTGTYGQVIEKCPATECQWGSAEDFVEANSTAKIADFSPLTFTAAQVTDSKGRTDGLSTSKPWWNTVNTSLLGTNAQGQRGTICATAGTFTGSSFTVTDTYQCATG